MAMIGMLRGKVWVIQPAGLIMDVQGVGYELTVPANFLSKLRAGQEIVIHTQVIMREDDLSLFGFATEEEKALFLALLSVSGIGPKAGMSILSTFGAEQVMEAIAGENVALLTKVPGIGKKTAERVVLELKEKYRKQGIKAGSTTGLSSPAAAVPDALDALLALGFGQEEARQALKQGAEGEPGGAEEPLPVEEQIKRALRRLAERR